MRGKSMAYGLVGKGIVLAAEGGEVEGKSGLERGTATKKKDTREKGMGEGARAD